MNSAENETDMERILSRDEFKDYLKENIKGCLPERYAEAEVSFKMIQKQGGVEYEVLLVRLDRDQATPSIPIDGIYEEYANGKIRLEDAAKEIADFRKGCPDDIGITGIDFTDFSNIKDDIFPKLISTEKNREYLKDKAYTMFNDMAVIYVADLGVIPGEGHMSVTLTNSLLEKYGVSREELHELAISNLSEKEPNIQPIFDMIGGMGLTDGSMQDPVNQFMYVVTNKEMLNGANMLLNEKAMEELAEKIGGDFAVIPSSIHECIAVPASLNEVIPINSMICEVNESTVDVSEQLSDHVYMYDSDEHTLMMPHEYELVQSIDNGVLSSDVWQEFTRKASRQEFDPSDGSFHGEASVYETNGIKVLESFEMPVAISRKGKVKLLDDYPLSRTATRHVLEFANQEMGFDRDRKISDIPVSRSRMPLDNEKIHKNKERGISSGIDWFGQDMGMAR